MKADLLPLQVFKDNCCKREVLNLHVFCKNFPDCNSKVILGRYQVGLLDHILKPLIFMTALCIYDQLNSHDCLQSYCSNVV